MSDLTPITGLRGPAAIWSVQDWHTTLEQLGPSTISKCYVKAIAHVKSVVNKWWHEYFYVIIRLPDGDDTIVVAERQSSQDQVVLPNWKATTGNLAYHPKAQMALPLQTWVFEEEKFRLVELTFILKEMNDDVPNYFIPGYTCYWFVRALVVKFEGLEIGKYEKKSWAYSSYMSWWWPWVTDAMRTAATDFADGWFAQHYQALPPLTAHNRNPRAADETNTEKIVEFLENQTVQWPDNKNFNLQPPTEAGELTPEEQQDLNKLKAEFSAALQTARDRSGRETLPMQKLREHLDAQA